MFLQGVSQLFSKYAFRRDILTYESVHKEFSVDLLVILLKLKKNLEWR